MTDSNIGFFAQMNSFWALCIDAQFVIGTERRKFNATCGEKRLPTNIQPSCATMQLSPVLFSHGYEVQINKKARVG